jgi:uncharacterized protein
MAEAAQNVAVWFEIPAANLERAVGFYEKVFESRLKRDKFDGMDMAIFPAQGQAVSGALMACGEAKASDAGTIVYLHAGNDLAAPLARAAQNGGRVAIPKTALPDGMGFFAHIIDTEGNRVGLHSPG